MNSIAVAVDRLGGLIDLAFIAESEFEKAAVFAATTQLVMLLEAEFEQERSNLLKSTERIRWGICAMIGYDITNGSDKIQHKSMALGALNTLRQRIEQ